MNYWTTNITKGSLLVFLIIFLFIGCNRKEKSSDEVSFNIDYSLLGPEIVNQELTIMFRHPKNWVAVNDSELKKASVGFETVLSKEKYNLLPFYIFANRKDGAFLNVSKVMLKTDSNNIALYEQYISNAYDSGMVSKTKFLKNGLEIHQWIIQDEMTVSFKLFFINTNNSIIQFDYVIPRSIYANNIKVLESSIGTIKPI